MKMKKFAALFLVLVFFAACRENSRFAINTAEHYYEAEIKRFDKDLIQLDTAALYQGFLDLYNKYPDFFPVYLSNVLLIEPDDTANAADFIREFLSDTVFAAVNKDVLQTYSKIGHLEKSVSEAYTYIHYYFPAVSLPEVYFFVSGFNLSVMMTEKILAMGTDMYLGADYPLYEDLTYDYMTANMKPENLVSDMISALLFREFGMDSRRGRLLDNMLYRGKVMYLLSVCLPGEKPENLIGYTSEQLKWCRRYERKIWASMIDQKHLFSTDNFLIRKYMNDAPFTSPVSPDSPGRLGTWLGWQIVKSYMQHNENATLEDLMKINDYQKLLEDSGYRP